MEFKACLDRKEETLDPENWDEITVLGHRIIDDMMEYLKEIRNKPYIDPTPDVENVLMASLSETGDGEDNIYNII